MNETIKLELRDNVDWLIADSQYLAQAIRKNDMAQIVKMATACIDGATEILALVKDAD